VLLLTLRGTPTMYYGDELGIGELVIPQHAVQDPWEKNEPGLGLGRDPSRTPFQWDATPNAGFTRGKPWLPVAPSFRSCNVEALRNENASILTLYRRLLSIRRGHAALSTGAFRLIGVQGNVLLYARTDENERIVVCLNFGNSEQAIGGIEDASILASTHPARTTLDPDLILGPNEGLVVLLKNPSA
jgi:alpha-glucosidase